MSSVASAQAALNEAVRRYDMAAAEFDAIEASVTADTEKLDDLIARGNVLSASLTQRAQGMYRTGPIEIIEVLVGSASFDDFLTRWDALVRLGRADANAIAEMKATRTEQARTVASLLVKQQIASERLRALDSAKTEARRQLASSKAAYAAYERRVADRQAAAASRRTADSNQAPTNTGAVSPAVSRPSDSTAPWDTALASWYGMGSVGSRTASGVVIGSDSMIVAHKTLPFGTLIEFSYGGRTAVASVADRGPFVPGREFDLGPGIARVLGFDGVDRVRYRVIER